MFGSAVKLEKYFGSFFMRHPLQMATDQSVSNDIHCQQIDTVITS